MANPIVEKAKERMTQSHQSLGREFGSIRAGRANASLLDRLEVEYYGALTPVNQLASITVPEARMLLITPYDKSSLNDIERAILMSDIGITPTSDGSVIRLIIPQLTEERRKELVKDVKKKGEAAKVAVRNIRRDANDAFKKLAKQDVSEDEIKDLEDSVQKLTDKFIKKIDAAVDTKAKEILTV